METKKRVGRPKGRTYTTFVGCRLPSKQGKFLTSMAKKCGLRQSDVIREAINHYMQCHSRK